MAVKKTQYTKKELVKLAKDYKFGQGHLVSFSGKMCALGWLLNLSGVHKSRMRSMSVYHSMNKRGESLTSCSRALGIRPSVMTGIYMDNDGALPEVRAEAVMDALQYHLPEDYVLNECEEEFKEEFEWL